MRTLDGGFQVDTLTLELPPFRGRSPSTPLRALVLVPKANSSSSSSSSSSRSSIAANPARRTISALAFSNELCIGEAFPRRDGEGAIGPAEAEAGAEVESDVEAKGDALDLDGLSRGSGWAV